MFVFYEAATGAIRFTIEGDSYPPHLVNESVGVIETEEPLGDIACWQVIEGALVKVTVAPVKATYMERIRQESSAVRLIYITDIVGQDMLYIVKREEAAAYVADPDPDLALYPLIAEEVGVTAPTAYEVAQVWLYMNAALKPIAGRLENIRLTATNAIASATTEAEVIAAYDTFALSLATESG
jgi:hypothetical protein